jgi:hypothetical protein
MSISQLFDLFNSIALLAWIPLFLPPKFVFRNWFLEQKIATVLLSASYLFLFLAFIFSGDNPNLDFSFEGIKQLFANDRGLLVAWIHYLAFDMMVGIYECEQAIKRGIPHWLLLPCLLFTFMLGPIGWLMFWLISRAYPLKIAD